MRKIIELLEIGVKKRASDLLCIKDKPPQLKIDGVFQKIEGEPILNNDDIIKYVRELVSLSRPFYQETDEIYKSFIEKIKNRGYNELSLTLSTEPITRLRISVYLQRGSLAIAIRLLPQKIFSFEEIFVLPEYIPKIKELLSRQNGLILVTGPTGSGKTTTLATFTDYILQTRAIHMITLEDPIEFEFDNRKYSGTISQCEFEKDFFNFADRIRAGMREVPNNFLVAEIRDLETAETALRAAETGHLVLSTLHTRNAAQTVGRYVDIFPENVRPQIRTMFSVSVIGIFCQRLVPRADGKGRVAVFEIVFVTPGYANMIREWKIHQLDSAVHGEVGIRYDEYLVELVKRGYVTRETALLYANDPKELRNLLS